MTARERQDMIMATLRKERRVTMKCLAEALCCSMCTVYRDITALSVSYPLVLTRGRYGGVALADWYHPHRAALCPEQILALRKAMAAVPDDQTRQALGSILDQFSS